MSDDKFHEMAVRYAEKIDDEFAETVRHTMYEKTGINCDPQLLQEIILLGMEKYGLHIPDAKQEWLDKRKALRGEPECNECTVDPEQLMRKNIIKEFAEQDFVRVRRCEKCGFYNGKALNRFNDNALVGWCGRYEEMRLKTDYCSEAKEK